MAGEEKGRGGCLWLQALHLDHSRHGWGGGRGVGWTTGGCYLLQTLACRSITAATLSEDGWVWAAVGGWGGGGGGVPQSNRSRDGFRVGIGRRSRG